MRWTPWRASQPGFDLEEVASSTNIEIHFVDSSGVIHWKFLGDVPDYEFCDWNFSNTTAEDYAWAVDRVHKDGRDIYISDFTHLGVYACRMLIPACLKSTRWMTWSLRTTALATIFARRF